MQTSVASATRRLCKSEPHRRRRNFPCWQARGEFRLELSRARLRCLYATILGWAGLDGYAYAAYDFGDPRATRPGPVPCVWPPVHSYQGSRATTPPLRCSLQGLRSSPAAPQNVSCPLPTPSPAAAHQQEHERRRLSKCPTGLLCSFHFQIDQSFK